MKRFIRNFDFPLFFAFLLVSLFGLVMIYSSSIVWAVGQYNYDSSHFFNKQVKNLAIAYPLFLAAAFFPYQNYKRSTFLKVSVLLSIALLVSVHFFGYGKEELGAQSWIRLGGVFNMQPSELVKLVLIIYFSSFFAKKEEQGIINEQLNLSLGPPLAVFLIVVGSVLVETDLGTSLIIIATSIIVLTASSFNKKNYWRLMGIVALFCSLAASVLWLFRDQIFNVSRKGRILSYLNPFDYETGSGYQIANSYIAMGAGGISGRGLGNSVQKMGYLPEPHTDVIMAIISEEVGIIGTIIVVGGLGFIVFRAFQIALLTKDPQGRMLAAGIGGMILVQTFINLGGLTGLLPLTGVPLPLVSYGGTSVLLVALSIGILMNVSMRTTYERRKEKNLLPPSI